MPGSTDIEDFARLIEALHPWLDQVVVIGGWAQRLYRLPFESSRAEQNSVFWAVLASRINLLKKDVNILICRPSARECLRIAQRFNTLKVS
jgi:hypothetical protein